MPVRTACRRKTSPSELREDREDESQVVVIPFGRPWVERLPLDLGIFVCQLLGADDLASVLLVSHKVRDLGLHEEVWRFFCRARWGRSANLHVYERAKDLYGDKNGWFPRRGGRAQPLRFDVQRLKLHDKPCLTMDLRITNEEIVAVSEAKFSGQAFVQIIDPGTRQLRERFTVSEATINCCDVGPGLICLGSDDSKVRLYRRDDPISSCSSGYQLAGDYGCASEVNDLRLAREDAVIAVRTHQNRHPAGLDVIPLERPDSRKSFLGGTMLTRGKFIHALDGFEDGCSLSCVACSGEHPITSSFSAMLFDFRRSSPCVHDKPVTNQSRQGHPVGTMLWPLRAGRDWRVYANLLHDDGQRRSGKGTIAMIDFRYPTQEICTYFQLPAPIDDFRCFDGSLYVACSLSPENTACSGSEHIAPQQMRVHRCNPSNPSSTECLSTVVEEYDPGQRNPREDLKVFSLCSRGFAASYGEYLVHGSVAEPRWL